MMIFANKQSWLVYLNDEWNIYDALGCLFFIIGFMLRIISLWTNSYVFTWAR